MSWLEEHNAREKAAKEKAKQNLLAKAEGLLKAGVKAVVVHYYGSGDEGSDDGTVFYSYVPTREDLSVLNYDERDGDIAAELIPDIIQPEDYAFDYFIPDGYEQNEGGQGFVVLDTEARKITCYPSWNVSTAEDAPPKEF